MPSEPGGRHEPVGADTAVEVFWRPGCPYCRGLHAVLLDHGVEATWRNIWTDTKARTLVREANNGDETVPTVRVGTTVLTNPSWRQLAPVLAGAAPAPGTGSSPRDRGARLGAGLRWGPIGLLVLAGEVLTLAGHPGAGYALDALALTAWWLTRPER